MTDKPEEILTVQVMSFDRTETFVVSRIQNMNDAYALWNINRTTDPAANAYFVAPVHIGPNYALELGLRALREQCWAR